MSSLHFSAYPGSDTVCATIDGNGRCAVAQKKDSANGSLDYEAMAVRYQQRLNVLDAVMRAAVDGLHAMAVRQCEAASAMTKLSADLLAQPGTPSGIDGYAKAGQELSRHVTEAALSHALALTEIAAKMQRETTTVLGQAACETIGDLCAILQNGVERR